MKRVGPKEWSPSRKGVKRLKTQAKDNHGYSYQVWLIFDAAEAKWILRIERTPGSWFMSTLLEYPERRTRISIDYGQGWEVTNFDEIMAEAITLV